MCHGAGLTATCKAQMRLHGRALGCLPFVMWTVSRSSLVGVDKW